MQNAELGILKILILNSENPVQTATESAIFTEYGKPQFCILHPRGFLYRIGVENKANSVRKAVQNRIRMACRIDADVNALPDPLPSDLTDVEERHAGAAAQLAKEILMLLVGIETKTGGSMAAAELSVFFKDAYDRWVGATKPNPEMKYCNAN